MERPVIILYRTLTRCCRPRTIMATGWASALPSIPGPSIIPPARTSHIDHTDIGHSRMVHTVHIITIGARQPLHVNR